MMLEQKEEELRRQYQMMQQHNQTLKHQSQQLHQQQQQQQQPPQPPQTLSYQSPYRSSYSSKMGSPGSVTTNDNHLSPSSTSAPPLPKSPPPNTYKSAMQSSSSPQKSPVTPPQSSPKPRSDKKTVSFNETVATNEPPASPQEDEQEDGEKVREDPNKFLSEATAVLASPRSPDVTIGTGSTPGVIGAQEVYRDPRMRRLAEKQQQQQAANTPKPEKLTFKEKMRMFAMESGDIESPKDKVKVSKAQREIEPTAN